MTTIEPVASHRPTETHRFDDLLWRHLKSVPAFRALLRAVEARFYRQIDIPEPVLDLGCGDGHFAQMAFDHPLTVGADPWEGPLRKAAATDAYRLNVQAMGNALPFPDRYFNTVISNSVLEHIPHVQPVLIEANRVLKPGGKLVVTMPSHLFTEFLGGAQLLRPLGLADTYRRFFNFISRHAHTDPPEEWFRRLAHAGFQVSRWQYYFSPGALRALEWGHVQGLPSAILHFLTGHWIVAPWRENLRYTERWVRPYYEEEYPDEGAYLFIVAQKVAERPISPQLPAANPLPLKEPELKALPTPESPRVEIPEMPWAEPADVVQDPGRFSAETGEQRDLVEAPERSETSGKSIVHLGLLALGLLLAVFAQTSLTARASEPWGGLYLYGLALLSLAAASVYLRRRKQRSTEATEATFKQQRLLYPLALLFAMWAQNQAGNTLFEGNPLAAFLLWLLAIGLGYYALMPVSKATRHDATAVDAQAALPQESTRAGFSFVHPIFLAFVLFVLAFAVRLLGITEHPAMLNGIEASIGLDALGVLRGVIRNPFAVAWLTNPTLPLYPLAGVLGLMGSTVFGIRFLSALLGALTVPVLYLIARSLWRETVALVAAILLVGYHFHLHYSRLGMTNVWDALLALLFLSSIALAQRQGSRESWLLAGLLTGFSAYLYTTSHLVPLFLLAIFLYFLLSDGKVLREQGRHMLAGIALAIVVALPQVIFYNANPDLFMERANSLGIFHTNWLANEVANTGERPLSILTQQFWQAMLAFNYSLDTSTTYNPGIPLLRFWPAVFFIIGLGLSIVRWRKFQYALLPIWLGITLIFAGALLVDAPDSHRLLIAAPAVILLVALGLTWFLQQLLAGLRTLSSSNADFEQTSSARELLLPVLLVIAVLFAAGDLLFYFGEYRNAVRFGDRNTEIAYEMSNYMQSLDNSWTVYFHGPPVMYVSFPTIPFLVGDEFQPQVNLFDVIDPAEPLPANPASGGNLVFIYLPERSNEVNATSEQFPGGRLRMFEGKFANPLFYAYEVRR